MARSAKLIIFLFVVVCGFFFIREPTLSTGKWAIPQPTNEEAQSIQSILSQKFTFLGEGAQAVAFESADGKYVLKLFKMHLLKPSITDHLCPHVVRRRLRNLHWVFNGYRNGYLDLRSETGLVWIHLTQTNYLNQNVTLHDRDGSEHQINADGVEFVIQEKAELIFDRLSRLKDEQELSKAIDAVRALIQRRIDMGYADRDKAVSNNFGFVGDRAIQLDIGRLYKKHLKKGHGEHQLEHVMHRIEQWQSELEKGKLS